MRLSKLLLLLGVIFVTATASAQAENDDPLTFYRNGKTVGTEEPKIDIESLLEAEIARDEAEMGIINNSILEEPILGAIIDDDPEMKQLLENNASGTVQESEGVVADAPEPEEVLQAAAPVEESGMAMMIVGGIVVVFAVGITFFFLMRKKKSPTSVIAAGTPTITSSGPQATSNRLEAALASMDEDE
ncbi:MAG: hypothetical protein O2904_04905 [bacterium]|nr:hypothetical protein [bacterium]